MTYPSNPILEQTDISVSDIVENQFIISGRDIGYCALLDKELKRCRIEVRPIMEMGSVGAIINVLLGGYGTSYIPKFMADKYLESGKLVKLEVRDIDIDLYSYYICSRHRRINPVMREFIRIVEENLWRALFMEN